MDGLLGAHTSASRSHGAIAPIAYHRWMARLRLNLINQRIHKLHTCLGTFIGWSHPLHVVWFLAALSIACGDDEADPQSDRTSTEDTRDSTTDRDASSETPTGETSSGDETSATPSDSSTTDTSIAPDAGRDAGSTAPETDSGTATGDASAADASTPSDASTTDAAPASHCEQCLASGGTWQVWECTESCGIADTACFTSYCPDPCGPDSCGGCFTSSECVNAGCQYHEQGESQWCTAPEKG